ncbi:MAG: DUF4339 domain-containing protein [Spirochaetales bacterium]|nr:DUF4339 domain-containing protein [Spirochaetales bacterium]
MNKIKIIIFSTLLIFGALLSITAQEPPPLPTNPPPLPNAQPSYYIGLNGEQAGPFNTQTLFQMRIDGKINAKTLVWKAGMDKWTPAGLVEELKDMFQTSKTETVQTESYKSKPEQQASNDSVISGRGLTYSEEKFAHKLMDKGIELTDKRAMKKAFGGNLAGGMVCAALGSTLFCIGLPVMVFGLYTIIPLATSGALNFLDDSAYLAGASAGYIAATVIGSLFTVAGLIITPCCAVGFSNAQKTTSIYKKTTNEKLFSFLSRTSIGGGYDWDNKELTVAMGIKL